MVAVIDRCVSVLFSDGSLRLVRTVRMVIMTAILTRARLVDWWRLVRWRGRSDTARLLDRVR